MIHIQHNTAYMQAHGCRFCFHIGGTAILFGEKKNGRGPRLELFTPMHWFRWSNSYSK